MVRRALLLTAALGVLSTVAGAAAEGPRHGEPCANLRGAASHTRFLRPGTLRGDVTGDGVADRVAVVEDPRVFFRCRFGVAVFSRHRTMVLPLGRFVDKPEVRSGQRWPFPQPLIRLLAALDRKRGAEIVVAVSAGASSEQAELLTVRRGRLARVRLPRSFGGRLAYFSIVPSGESFDCRGPGSGELFDAWYSSMDARGHRWQYELDRYRIAGIELRRVSTRRAIRTGYRPPRWWRRYYSEPWPFRHCAVADHR